MKKIKACKDCKTLSEEDLCLACKGKTTTNWAGYLVVLDQERSEVAKRLNLKQAGRYALKVR